MHANLTDSEQVTVVDNSVHSHDGSISDRTTDTDTAWRPDWDKEALRHATSSSKSHAVFAHETSLRVLPVYIVNVWHKYHLQDFVGRC